VSDRWSAEAAPHPTYAGVRRPATTVRGDRQWGRNQHVTRQQGRYDHPDRPTSSKENILVSSDAIVLLKNDHKQIKKLFKQFQDAGANARKTKGSIVTKIIEALTVHTYLENECMYPEVRKLLPDLEADVLESYEEHHVADLLCMELFGMEPSDERFDAKTTVLIENVTHHIEEEENEWFPKVREGLSRKALQDIGVRLSELKDKAPRSPAQPSALKKTVDAIIK